MTKGEDRRALLDAPRPVRRLEVVGSSIAAQRAPLAADVRDVDRRDRPIYAVWEITLACDLACRHCGSRAGRPRPDELSTAEALDLVAQMHDLGVKEIALIGGEVYLYEGWTEVVREIRRRGMTSTLVTGGRGMTPERARMAKEAGVQSVAVSLDGDEETHDRLRGARGTFRAALAALSNLREAGVQVAVNTQVNRLSEGELEIVFDRVREAGCHGWQVQLTVPAGRAADEPEVLLQPYDLLALFPRLARLKERADAAGIKLLSGNNIGYFGPYEHLLRSHCVDRYAGSCPAGRAGLGIEANGDIKGCPSLGEEWIGGNVRVDRLKDIWERAAALRHNRDRTRAELWGHCADCYYGSECGAGCTWMTTSLFGRPGNNPYCHHRALELERRGLRERVERIAEAPGRPFDRASWRLVEEASAAERPPIHLFVDGDEQGEQVVARALADAGRRVVPVGRSSLAAQLSEIEILLASTPPKVDWSRAKRLRFLQLMGSGTDALWPAEGLGADVVIANARGVHLPEMRDHALALLFALERDLHHYVTRQADREWKPVVSGTLSGKTVAILGLGAVGRSLAEACAALGMRVVGAVREPRAIAHVEAVYGPGELRAMFEAADHLVVTAPLTGDTRGLVDARALSWLRPSATVVNVSRGAIVDATALEAALRQGRLRGAALDVFDDEPLSPESSLWSTPNLLVTPHVAGLVADYAARVVRLFLENLGQVEQGLPPRTEVRRDRRY